MSSVVYLQKDECLQVEIRRTRPVVEFWGLTLNVFWGIYRWPAFKPIDLFSPLFICCPAWRTRQALKLVRMGQLMRDSLPVFEGGILKSNIKNEEVRELCRSLLPSSGDRQQWKPYLLTVCMF